MPYLTPGASKPSQNFLKTVPRIVKPDNNPPTTRSQTTSQPAAVTAAVTATTTVDDDLSFLNDFGGLKSRFKRVTQNATLNIALTDYLYLADEIQQLQDAGENIHYTLAKSTKRLDEEWRRWVWSKAAEVAKNLIVLVVLIFIVVQLVQFLDK